MNAEYLEFLLNKNEPGEIMKVIEFKSESALGKGENYMSTITRFTIKVLLKSGETATRSLIVKAFPDEKLHCSFLVEFSYFKNEILAYSKVLCKMKSLMEEFQDNRETLWCEMFDYVPHNKLILQDLKEVQYVTMNRRDNLDYEHTVCAIKSLARLHAMSAVIIKRNIISPNDFEPFTFAKKGIVKYFFWSCLTKFETAVRTSWSDKWSYLPALIRNIAEKAYDKMQELSKIDEKRFNVINHGDSWTNNLMFKHDEATKKPINVKFVDFQITHYNSFAWDLTYFFYNSILPEIRRANYNKFLTIYHKELINNLEFFNFPKNKIPKLKEILNEMKRINFFAFLLLLSIYPWTSAESDNPYDVEKVLTDEDNPENGVNIEIFTCPKYRERVENDLIDFINEGMLSD